MATFLTQFSPFFQDFRHFLVSARRKFGLDAGKRKEIADSVISGRKSGAEMARLYNISAPTVSRIVAQHRTGPP